MLPQTPVATVPNEVKMAFLLLSILEFAVGILANAFIFLVNLWDVIKRRPLSSCDLLLLSLSITRLFQHGLLFLEAIQLTHFQKMKAPLSGSYQTILILWVVTNKASLGFATCLSILYCSKIVHISHVTLFCVARNFSSKIPQVLLGVILFSCACTLLCLWDFFTGSRSTVTPTLLVNSTEKGNAKIHLFYSFLYCNLGSILPFLCFLASSGLLIISLGRHMGTMKASASDSQGPSLKAHIKVLKLLVSFLCFYVVAFCTALLSVPFMMLWQNKLGAMVCVAVMAMCPSGHSIILISGSRKLRKATETTLRWVQRGLKIRVKHKEDPQVLDRAGA